VPLRRWCVDVSLFSRALGAAQARTWEFRVWVVWNVDGGLSVNLNLFCRLEQYRA
jgi:hypothetical protein